MDIRTQFADLYLEDQLPALEALTNKEFKMFPSQYTEVFRVMDSSRSIEQDTGVGQFGLFEQTIETGGVDYDSLNPSFPKTYVHLTFSKGYELSHELVADDKFGLADANARALGRSARITPEVLAASHFNSGFSGSFLGPDGVALFSTAHPKESGGTQANRPTAGVDLNVQSLEVALTTMRQLTDDRGKLLQLPPQKLIVPPQLEFRAAEILGGTMRSDTANNTINAFRQRSDFSSFNQWMVWDYLTAARAWFVTADKSQLGLKFWWRERFNTLSKMEFETRSAKTAGWMRFVSGWSWWQGNYGSPGA